MRSHRGGGRRAVRAGRGGGRPGASSRLSSGALCRTQRGGAARVAPVIRGGGNARVCVFGVGILGSVFHGRKGR